ncbi:MAG: Gfo/Idh/MocA family oxidoreductase [Parcubacteria group bacterium]|nr:Gfo/Idh/MocA family oxidoreductase [Parcubacteria group bacterium]
MRVKIYGTGSIGNHLAHACRNAGWNVVVVGRSNDSLLRMQKDIYPTRYGVWDAAIDLSVNGSEPTGGFDCIFIGTPPDTHLSHAMRILRKEPPRVLQIEKPLCAPSLENMPEFLEEAGRHPETMVIVGYNHVVSKGEQIMRDFLKEKSGSLGAIRTIDVTWREHWEGTFRAHPWLSGPHDSYLGFFERGGGASGERAHGLHLWQYFAHLTGAGRVKEVSATFDFLNEGAVHYDRQAFLILTTESGLVGRVVLDVISLPPEKKVVLQCEHGRLEWAIEDESECVSFWRTSSTGGATVKKIIKTRASDFFGEIEHIGALISQETPIEQSPLRLFHGLETARVLNAAYQSHVEKSVVAIPK